MLVVVGDTEQPGDAVSTLQSKSLLSTEGWHSKQRARAQSAAARAALDPQVEPDSAANSSNLIRDAVELDFNDIMHPSGGATGAGLLT